MIAPYDPIQGALADRLQPPSPEHWMGTDLQGRDEFTRILYGAQVSLQVGVVSVMLALIMGGTLGAVAGAAEAPTSVTTAAAAATWIRLRPIGPPPRYGAGAQADSTGRDDPRQADLDGRSASRAARLQI